nr:unnamed protein product [Haemonchus contortus]
MPTYTEYERMPDICCCRVFITRLHRFSILHLISCQSSSLFAGLRSHQLIAALDEIPILKFSKKYFGKNYSKTNFHPDCFQVASNSSWKMIDLKVLNQWIGKSQHGWDSCVWKSELHTFLIRRGDSAI